MSKPQNNRHLVLHYNIIDARRSLRASLLKNSPVISPKCPLFVDGFTRLNLLRSGDLILTVYTSLLLATILS